MYEKNKGYALPPPAAIERQMVELGVPLKQKERARQVFQKSAALAQFIDPGSGRFTKPAVGDRPKEAEAPPKERSKGGGDEPPTSEHHPFVAGLLSELPPMNDYKDWRIEDQAEWLRAAASIFKLLSKQQGRIKIEVVGEKTPTGESQSASAVE